MKKFIKKHWILISLIILILVTRLPILISQVIPFTFDHGKDALAVLDMMLNADVKLIGPWTSIPGLYFGPGWYYLLLLAFIIGGGHPLSPVYLMLLLLIVQVILAYKYLNKWTALIMATAPVWLTVSTSAWNPFPMTFISLICLILLKEGAKKQQFNFCQSLSLGLAVSLGFHFSSAYAVFMQFLVLISLFILKIKLNLKDWLALIVGLITGFVPQILFELTHDFMETKAVIDYFRQNSGQNIALLTKITQVISVFFKETKSFILPNIWIANEFLAKFINSAIIIFFAVISLILLIKKSLSKNRLALISLVWLLIPLIGFFFLHFNLWYILAMAPWLAYLLSLILKYQPKLIQKIVVILFVFGSISHLINFQFGLKNKLAQKRDFLPVKIQALSWIRQQAGEKSFASYQYAPHIYDFSYQYLYFWQGLTGHKLPVEFSYRPNELSYVTQKTNLLNHFKEKDLVQAGEPEYIFYIVEKAFEPAYLEEWWQHQNYSEIIAEKEISSELTVYQALPN